MGLDMYLRGNKFLRQNWDNPELDEKQDGFRISNIELDLGYWRKHPNLHGFIVQTFAGGVDECQEIELGADEMRQIIAAVEAGTLPHTEGFFFGASDGSEKAEDIEVFTKAIAWLESPPPDERVWRSVVYRASW